MFRRTPSRVSIPKPCNQNWDTLEGTAAARFCESCGRSVHDLSTLTRKQVEQLILSSPGGLCGRIPCDQNGELLFQPERQPAIRDLVRIAVLGASAIAIPASAAEANQCSVQVRVLSGDSYHIHNAKVSFSRTDTPSPIREAVTDANGISQQQLDAGQYRLQVESPGFETSTREVHLACNASSPATIDVSLPLLRIMGEVEIRPTATPPPATGPATPNLLSRLQQTTSDLLYRLQHLF